MITFRYDKRDRSWEDRMKRVNAGAHLPLAIMDFGEQELWYRKRFDLNSFLTEKGITLTEDDLTAIVDYFRGLRMSCRNVDVEDENVWVRQQLKKYMFQRVVRVYEYCEVEAEDEESAREELEEIDINSCGSCWELNDSVQDDAPWLDGIEDGD